MAYKLDIRRQRQRYAKLLRCYPKPYRERFAEGMEQTFGDVLREQAQEGKSVSGHILWMFLETSGGIISENIKTMNLLKNNFIRIAIGTALLLTIPLALQLTIGTGVDGQGFNWKPSDFVFAFVLICGTASLFELARRQARGNGAYTFAAALALIATFLLIWVNGAVGLIGDEDNPANLLYGAVILVGFLGAILARLEAHRMSYALFAMAAAQLLVPAVAFFMWRPTLDEAPGFMGVLALNACFAALFAGSALLFRQARIAVAK